MLRKTQSYKVVKRTESDNTNFNDNINCSISLIENAIDRITYHKDYTDSTGYSINISTINKLNNIVYELDSILDDILYKPIAKRRLI